MRERNQAAVSDADAYETVVKEWASLAALPEAEWDTGRMNALVNQMQLLQLRLRDSEDGRSRIEQLAADANPRVRAWAAVHALKWNSTLTRRILTELRDSGGPASFEAEWTLREMDRGTLNIDWTPRR